MEILFFFTTFFAGFLLSRRASDPWKRTWGVILSAWLSVPIGFALWLGLGLWIAHMGDCDISARAAITCIVGGVNVSDWANSLVAAGYVGALIVLPWLVIGGILVAAIGILQAFDQNKT